MKGKAAYDYCFLSARGQLTKEAAKAAAMWVTNEVRYSKHALQQRLNLSPPLQIKKLVDVMVKEGRRDRLGRIQCTFSVIYEKTLDILQVGHHRPYISAALPLTLLPLSTGRRG